MLAGFCLGIIIFILGWNVAEIRLVENITYGQIAVLFTGIASALFIVASELFLTAKENDIWSLPEKFNKFLIDGFKEEDKDWDKLREENDIKCKLYEKYGRICYNSAIFIIFIGMFFVITPYNIFIAIIIACFGIGLELYQMVRKP